MDDSQVAAGSVAVTARIATDNATRYLTQLCKHFGHRLPVTRGDDAGEITFPLGVCKLRAEPGVLTLDAAAASATALPQLEDVVARHLVRFAFREAIEIAWQPAA